MDIVTSVLSVYIGALLKNGNVVCQKQFLACEVGKPEKSYRKFQSTSEPNLWTVCQQLFFCRYSLVIFWKIIKISENIRKYQKLKARWTKTETKKINPTSLGVFSNTDSSAPAPFLASRYCFLTLLIFAASSSSFHSTFGALEKPFQYAWKRT